MGYKTPPKNRQFGQPEGNKQGSKTKGSLSKETIFLMAAKEVAQALRLGEEPDRVKVELVKTGFREAFKGNYSFWLKLMMELGLLTEEEKLKITATLQSQVEQKLEISPELQKAADFYEAELIRKLKRDHQSKHAGLDKGSGNSKRKGKSD